MYIPIETAPGVVKSRTEYDSPGRWVESDKVRDDAGEVVNIGGYVQLGTETVDGCPRGSRSWRDTNSQRYLIVGTNRRVYRSTPDGVLTNITPARDSGTLTSDPFTTTNSSNVVTVADTGHGVTEDATVVISTAGTLNGVVLDGTWTVNTVPGANTYTFLATDTATADGTGGGTAAEYLYEINPGLCDGIEGFGFGAGVFGTSFFGIARPTSITISPRVWSFSNYGEDILGCHNVNGTIWRYDVSAGGRMAIMSTNAPTASYVFVTNELHVVALGADGDPYRIENSDQNDVTDWTSTTTNQADGYSVPGGDALVAGRPYKNGMNVIWTLDSVWTRTLIAQRPFWLTQHRGAGMGLISQHAHVELGDRIYWMSNQSFHVFDGVSAQEVPNVEDVRDWVFGDINLSQQKKFWATTVRRNSEAWFFYCSADSGEIDRAVSYVPSKGIWWTHTFDRTTGVDRGVMDFPVWLDADGKLYEHESGVDANGAAMEKYVRRAPSDIKDGNVTMDVQTIVPDVKNQAGPITYTFYSKDWPNSATETDGPYSFGTADEDIDVRISGRQIGFKVSSNVVGGAFRHGKLRVDAQPAGENY